MALDKAVKILSVCCVLILMIFTTSCFPNFPPSPAKITPTDAFIFIGDKLKLWVYTNDIAKFPISDLHIRVRIRKTKEVFNKTLTAVNNTHGYHEIEGTKEMLDDKNTVSCHCPNGDQVPFCSTFVAVENRIRAPTDGILYWLYNKNLLVTWELAQQYNKIKDINVTVYYKYSGNVTEESAKCNNSMKTNCTISDYRRQSKVFVLIVVALSERRKEDYQKWSEFITTNSESVLMQKFEFHPMYLVKPQIQNGLTVEEDKITSQCITVSFGTPEGIKNFDYPLIYEIVFSNIEEKIDKKNIKEGRLVYCDREKIRKREKDSSSEECYQNSTISIQMCGLEDATDYRVSFKVKPEPGHWSDTIITTASTNEDRPDHSPPFEVTSFSVGPCDKTGFRTVTAYWNEPLKVYTNGKPTNYSITFFGNRAIVEPTFNQVSSQTPCDQTLKLEMLSYTKMGSSRKSSSLLIPSEEEALQLKGEMDFKVQINESSGVADMNCTWAVENREETRDVVVVIYYCHAPPFTLMQCDGDFKTVKVPLNDGYYLLNSLPTSMDLFGYALKKGSKVAGITWVKCMYDIEKKPSKPSWVKPKQGGDYNSIFVAWEPQYCTKNELTLVLRYHLKICPQPNNANELCIVKQVQGSSSSNVNVNNLDGARLYKITVQGESIAGMGLESDPELIKTRKREDEYATWTIIGSILSVLILAGIIFVCIWHIRKRKKKIDMLIIDNDSDLPESFENYYIKSSLGSVVSKSTGTITIRSCNGYIAGGDNASSPIISRRGLASLSRQRVVVDAQSCPPRPEITGDFHGPTPACHSLASPTPELKASKSEQCPNLPEKSSNSTSTASGNSMDYLHHSRFDSFDSGSRQSSSNDGSEKDSQMSGLSERSQIELTKLDGLVQVADHKMESISESITDNKSSGDENGSHNEDSAKSHATSGNSDYCHVTGNVGDTSQKEQLSNSRQAYYQAPNPLLSNYPGVEHNDSSRDVSIERDTNVTEGWASKEYSQTSGLSDRPQIELTKLLGLVQVADLEMISIPEIITDHKSSGDENASRNEDSAKNHATSGNSDYYHVTENVGDTYQNQQLSNSHQAYYQAPNPIVSEYPGVEHNGSSRDVSIERDTDDIEGWENPLNSSSAVEKDSDDIMSDIALFMDSINIKECNVSQIDSRENKIKNSRDLTNSLPAGIERRISGDSGVASPGVQLTADSPNFLLTLNPFLDTTPSPTPNTAAIGLTSTPDGGHIISPEVAQGQTLDENTDSRPSDQCNPLSNPSSGYVKYVDAAGTS